MKQPLVSVIVPVYNAEKYLEECIDSVIRQDIGFSKNIEIVLVNDGSTDGSDAICRTYAEKYPNNIVYISQKNAGASHARNTGLKTAGGQFISFLDADDYISKNAINAVMDFFKRAPQNIEVATIRVVQFGSKNRERPINKKFDQGTRVIDLNNPEWFDICPRVAPSFIRSSVAKKYHFHEEIRFYEDTRYFNEVAAHNMKIGVVSKGTYFNRKHEEGDHGASITTGATNEKRFYLDSPEKVSLYLLKKFKGKNQYPPLYFQYLVQYEMRWRMFYNTHTPQEVLTTKEYKHYQKINKEILSYISDEALVGFKLSHAWQRVYLLNLKHDTDILKEAYFNIDRKLMWHDHVLFNHMKKLQVKLTDFQIDNNKFILKGYFADFVTKDVEVYPRVGGVRHEIELTPNSVDTTSTTLEYRSSKRTAFVTKISLNKQKLQRIDFAFTLKGQEYCIKRLNLLPMFGHETMPPKYSKIGGYLISWRKEGLVIAPDTLFSHIGFETGRVKRYLIELYKRVSK